MAPSLFEITHLHAFVDKLADNYSIRTHHACNTPGIQPKIERQMLIQKSFVGRVSIRITQSLVWSFAHWRGLPPLDQDMSTE